MIRQYGMDLYFVRYLINMSFIPVLPARRYHQRLKPSEPLAYKLSLEDMTIMRLSVLRLELYGRYWKQAKSKLQKVCFKLANITSDALGHPERGAKRGLYFFFSPEAKMVHGCYWCSLCSLHPRFDIIQ